MCTSQILIHEIVLNQTTEISGNLEYLEKVVTGLAKFGNMRGVCKARITSQQNNKSKILVKNIKYKYSIKYNCKLRLADI